jgi:lipoate-protein ligase B
MDYVRGWAWQQLILGRRLAFRHRQRHGLESSISSTFVHENIDTDTILIMEHSPVYTLGRGADENNISFLHDSNESVDANENTNIYITNDCRKRLSRTYRESDSARLHLDRHVLNGIHPHDYFLSFPINDDHDAAASSCRSDDHVIVEHLTRIATPVYTPCRVPIYRVERGGEVTFHGPGQLVVYPILDLLANERWETNLHWYLRQVEEVIIRTLVTYGIDHAVRDPIHSGVWINNAKIAAVGVSASRWITSHGFALNVNPDLSYFDTNMIIPCGIEGKHVTSIAQVLRERFREDVTIPTLEEVANVVTSHFMDVFGMTIRETYLIQ